MDQNWIEGLNWTIKMVNSCILLYDERRFAWAWMTMDCHHPVSRHAISRWLFGCLLCFSLFLIHPLNSNAAENSFINRIQERGYIRIGLPPYDTPPAYYVDPVTNKLSGYDVEFAKKLAEKLQVDVEFDTDSENFNDLVRRVGANEFDLALGKLGTTYARLFNAFPIQYMQLRHALLANRKRLEANNLSTALPDFGDRLKKSKIRVGSIGKSIWDTEIGRVLPNANLVKFKSWDDAKESLFNGEIDAIYRDATEIKSIIYEDPNRSIYYVPILFDDELTMTSVYMSEEGKLGFSDFLNFFIDREWGDIKTDSDILEEFKDYYLSLSPLKS